MLGVFGLGVEEEDVYRYLLATKPATAADMQAGMGMPLDRAQGALARLEEAGFTYRHVEDPVRYAAASPSAVDARILHKLADLREAQEQIGGDCCVKRSGADGWPYKLVKPSKFVTF